MSIFFVTALKSEEALERAIKAQSSLSAHPVKPGQWLVSFNGTSMELSALLGITGGDTGSAIVFAISGYYGRAPTSVWEWIKAHWESGHVS